MLMEREHCPAICYSRPTQSLRCKPFFSNVSVLSCVQENYGKKDSTSESRVKNVFSQKPISIPKRFEAFEKESLERITALIGKVDEEGTGMKKEVFFSFLNKVYKRSK